MAQTHRWFHNLQFEQSSRQWFQAIDRLDNCCILFFPKTDRPRRLDQLLNDIELREKYLKRKTVFLPIDLTLVEDKMEFQDEIRKHLNMCPLVDKPLSFAQWIAYLRKNKISIVIIIPDAERYLTPQGKYVFTMIASFIHEFEDILSIMTTYECNILDPQYKQYIPIATNLYNKVFYYPLYEKKDAVALIKYLALRWDIVISKKQEAQILTACGGHLWLVAEAVRQIAEKGAWWFHTDSIIQRVKMIYDGLSSLEKTVLFKLGHHVSNYTKEEEDVVLYFQRIRLVDDHREITVKLLEEHAGKYGGDRHLLTFTNNHFVLDQMVVDRFFSTKEKRVLRVFLEKQGEVVLREMIAKALWPTDTEKQYSDWAIDQMIARLRKKFEELDIRSCHIQSQRGKGYLLTCD